RRPDARSQESVVHALVLPEGDEAQEEPRALVREGVGHEPSVGPDHSHDIPVLEVSFDAGDGLAVDPGMPPERLADTAGQEMSGGQGFFSRTSPRAVVGQWSTAFFKFSSSEKKSASGLISVRPLSAWR